MDTAKPPYEFGLAPLKREGVASRWESWVDEDNWIGPFDPIWYHQYETALSLARVARKLREPWA